MKDERLNDEQDDKPTRTENVGAEDRRDALKKFGKYAVYAAPFTIMAVSAKAASASGPRRH